jgi:hypothetical protein
MLEGIIDDKEEGRIIRKHARKVAGWRSTGSYA